MHARLHPLTGQPLTPIFTDRHGRVHWPILGGALEGDQDSGAPVGDGGQGGTGVNEHGFPDNTPWVQMEPAQQTAYWRHQAQKHEGRASARGDYDEIKAERDTLKAAGQTPDQKALDEARTEAKAEVRREIGTQAVDIHVKALASAGRLTDDAAEIILDGLDKMKYLTADGMLDSDKLASYLNVVAPAKDAGEQRQRRDPHQGNRQNGGSTNRPGSVAQVMADRAAARAAKKN